jgi:Tfp pilus assembly protein PilV
MLTGVSHPGSVSVQPYPVAMSWTHALTTHEFWVGVPLGALVTGVVAPIITARSVRASDRRKAEQEQRLQALKAEQEEKMQARKEEREDKLREQESLYTAAMEFVEVSTDILVTAIDIKGIFNAMRDMFYNRAGLDDPMADAKFDHSEKVMDAQMRIAVPVNKLKLVAPTNVLDSAMRTSAAIMTTVRQTTEPFAKQVAHRAASDELNNFYNVFRQEVGREPYADERAREQALSFMEMLKKQVDDYIEEAKADMRAAGFKTTPWDNRPGKSA